MKSIFDFDEIWLADFEYSCEPGELPRPICLVALEYKSKKKIRLWEEELREAEVPPYSISSNAVFVAYYCPAEFSCHHALGWKLPRNVYDLFAEFRCVTNNNETKKPAGLLNALTYYGLDAMDTAEKDEMRNLALRGGPWTEEEKQKLLDYCESDVVALERLLPFVEPKYGIHYALNRGEYMKAVSVVEKNGIPIDRESLDLLKNKWPDIRDNLIQSIDKEYGVYDGSSFRVERFAHWLNRNNISWPRLPTGNLDLGDDTFKEMARSHPEVSPLRELRSSLSKFRLSSIEVGGDNRNRCGISPFGSKTGRNQPSNAKFIFGPSVWLRGLIKPEKGHGLAYIDWSQQEFGIAASLSGDLNMLAAYESGDPYLAFAKQAEAVPRTATKKSHGHIREQFKACVLAVQYGMGDKSLATRIGQTPARARELLGLHRKTYPTFWRWSDAVVSHAMMMSELFTTLGWELNISDNPNRRPNERSIRNFPMQANGAEMLRLACCFCVENSIKVCAPVHDAILIEAPLEQLDEHVQKAQQLMAKASSIILDGFELDSDAKVIRYPERYMDERGQEMWERVWSLIDNGETATIQPQQNATVM